MSATLVRALCLLPAPGLLKITLPLATPDDLTFVILPTAQSACFNAVFAAASVRPVSFGTTQPLLIWISLTVLAPLFPLPPEFATQTWLRSDDTPSGRLPTGIVLTTVPVDASISLTVSPPEFATHTWVPSDDTPMGRRPTVIVRTTVAVDASISLTVSPTEFATQTWVPSDDTPQGPLPTVIVRTTVPVDASISLTVSPPEFATHT